MTRLFYREENKLYLDVRALIDSAREHLVWPEDMGYLDQSLIDQDRYLMEV